MAQIKGDKVREERIIMEVVVDAYDEVERSLGWYYYLKDTMQFPFKAKCIGKRATSPLQVGDKVEVIGMPAEDDCEHEMFVNIKWQKQTLAVPLSQLAPEEVDEDTQQAVEDWHYWVARGYEF